MNSISSSIPTLKVFQCFPALTSSSTKYGMRQVMLQWKPFPNSGILSFTKVLHQTCTTTETATTEMWQKRCCTNRDTYWRKEEPIAGNKETDSNNQNSPSFAEKLRPCTHNPPCHLRLFNEVFATFWQFLHFGCTDKRFCDSWLDCCMQSVLTVNESTCYKGYQHVEVSQKTLPFETN